MSLFSPEVDRVPDSPMHPPTRSLARPPIHPVDHHPRPEPVSPEQEPEAEEAQYEPSSGSGLSVLLIAGLLIALVVWLTGGVWAGPGTQGHPAGVPFSPAPVPATSLVQLAERDARDAGIPPDLFVRQIQQESGFHPRALSPAGAEGIAQFMPQTAAGLGIDPWNPAQALQAAAFLMAHYVSRYGGYAEALAAYNCGPGCLAQAKAACGTDWQACLPAETQAYIRLILAPSALIAADRRLPA